MCGIIPPLPQYVMSWCSIKYKDKPYLYVTFTLHYITLIYLLNGATLSRQASLTVVHIVHYTLNRHLEWNSSTTSTLTQTVKGKGKIFSVLNYVSRREGESCV